MSKFYPVEEAIMIATEIHRGQTDKGKQPYILHPLRVGSAFRKEEYQIVGILHDVFEDSQAVSIEELPFSEDIKEALFSITHQNGESYEHYLRRCRSNTIARIVKLRDIRDNMNPSRLAKLDQLTQQRLYKKYNEARTFLLEEREESEVTI